MFNAVCLKWIQVYQKKNWLCYIDEDIIFIINDRVSFNGTCSEFDLIDSGYPSPHHSS